MVLVKRDQILKTNSTKGVECHQTISITMASGLRLRDQTLLVQTPCFAPSWHFIIGKTIISQLEGKIAILSVISSNSSHKRNLEVLIIKTIYHEFKSNHQIERYNSIKFQWPVRVHVIRMDHI